MTYCLVKKYICNIKLIIWWLNFSKNVMKFGFEDYYNSFFNPIYRYSASWSLFIEKRKRKKVLIWVPSMVFKMLMGLCNDGVEMWPAFRPKC